MIFIFEASNTYDFHISSIKWKITASWIITQSHDPAGEAIPKDFWAITHSPGINLETRKTRTSAYRVL